MLKIFARKSDGTEFFCFTWTRDEKSGIARAFSDAKKFGVDIVSAWVE